MAATFSSSMRLITHSFNLAVIVQELAGWTTFWSHTFAHSAALGILLKSGLLSSGEMITSSGHSSSYRWADG